MHFQWNRISPELARISPELARISPNAQNETARIGYRSVHSAPRPDPVDATSPFCFRVARSFLTRLLLA